MIYNIASLQAKEEHKIIACLYTSELTIEVHCITFESSITGELKELYIYFRDDDIICTSTNIDDMIYTFKMDLNGRYKT